MDFFLSLTAAHYGAGRARRTWRPRCSPSWASRPARPSRSAASPTWASTACSRWRTRALRMCSHCTARTPISRYAGACTQRAACLPCASGGQLAAALAFVKTLRAVGVWHWRFCSRHGRAAARRAAAARWRTLFLPHARASLGPAALRLTRGAAAQVEVRALVQRALGRPFPLEQARAPAHAVGVRSSAAYVPCEYALPLSPRHV